MTRTVATRLVDDLDGSPATQTVVFEIDRRRYTIDLDDDHAAALRELFAPYVAVARRMGQCGSARRSAPRPGPVVRTKPAEHTSLAPVVPLVRVRRPEPPDPVEELRSLVAELRATLRQAGAEALATAAGRLLDRLRAVAPPRPLATPDSAGRRA